MIVEGPVFVVLSVVTPPFPPAVAPWGTYGVGVQSRSVPSLSSGMLAGRIGTRAMEGVLRFIGSYGVDVTGSAICTATLWISP